MRFPVPFELACWLFALSLTACSSNDRSSSGSEQPERHGAPTADLFSQSFDGSPGRLPDRWLVGTSNAPTNDADGRWELTVDASAPSPTGTLALVDARGHTGQAYNLCWTPEPIQADVEVSVAVHAAGGVEDQGGGPAWRITGPDDYYVARWNPLEDNFRVYSVQAGQRQQLDSARVRTDPDAWHTIRIRHVGDEITCWFDGRELLHTNDSALTGPGAVGVWTKADATTRFDDLTVRPAR